MAIDKKLICFARLEEFERQLAAGNILGKSIVFIQDAKKIWNWGTYYDCNGGSSVYAWEWDGSEGGAFSQEEFDKMKSADIVVVKSSDQMYVADCSYAENWIQLLIHTGTTQMLASQIFTISPEGWQLTETQVYSIPTKVSELDNDSKFVEEENLATINGQSLTEGGDIEIGADNVYITDFTVNDLLTLAAEEGVIHASIDMLSDALSAHKVILVPYDANEGFQGYAVANGYMEDLLYLTVAHTDGWIDLELNHDLNEIRSYMVTLQNWSNKQDKLVSGTNIKTINGTSILGSGNIEIKSGEANVQSDWLETNESLDSYVKNRTHYVTGTKITSAGSYSIGASTPIYYREKVYNLEIGVRTQIESNASGVYVTLENGGILRVEDAANLLSYFPIIAVSEIVPLDDMFIPDTIARTSELKTINGESIVGIGNIEISGGESFWYEEEDGNLTTDYPVAFSQAATFINGIEASTSTPDGSISKGLAGQVLTSNGEQCYWADAPSEDIRYFTEFTFDEFINACKNESYISSNGLYDAIINNKLICIPDGDAGYIVSDSNYIEASHVENMYFFSLRVEAKSIVYEASIDTDDLTKDSLAGSLPLKRFVIQESLSSPNENGLYQDNTVYFISNEVDTLVINAYGMSGNAYGTTICFTTGDDPVLEIVGDVLWANGAAPEIEANTTYELSLRADDNYINILAVLVPFKSA